MKIRSPVIELFYDTDKGQKAVHELKQKPVKITSIHKTYIETNIVVEIINL